MPRGHPRTRGSPRYKYCLWCKKIKPRSAFSLRMSAGRKYSEAYCKLCKKHATEKWREDNPEAHAEIKKSVREKGYWKRKGPRWEDHLRRSFGITAEDYNRTLEFQGGVCAICEEPPKKRRLAVDHDHKTGEIRGLLCWRCNHTLGSLERGRDPEWLVEVMNKIIEYVTEYPFYKAKAMAYSRKRD